MKIFATLLAALAIGLTLVSSPVKASGLYIGINTGHPYYHHHHWRHWHHRYHRY